MFDKLFIKYVVNYVLDCDFAHHKDLLQVLECFSVQIVNKSLYLVTNISVNKDTKLKLRCHSYKPRKSKLILDTRDSSNGHDQVRTISLLNVTNIINSHTIITSIKYARYIILLKPLPKLYHVQFGEWY